MAGTVRDDEEILYCYRHATRETALQCIDCDRPICIERCAVQGAVGFKCPDHARTSRSARGVVPVGRVVRGLGAGAAVAGVLGGALAVAPIPFFGIILGYVVGIAAGEATKRASGGFRDPVLARGAAVCAVIGVAWLPVASMLTRPASVQSLAYSLIAAGFAAAGALSRAA